MSDAKTAVAEPLLPPDWEQHKTISVEQAGEVLGISRDLAYKAAARGDIPVIRIGPKRLRVPTARLLAMLGGE